MRSVSIFGFAGFAGFAATALGLGIPYTPEGNVTAGLSCKQVPRLCSVVVPKARNTTVEIVDIVVPADAASALAKRDLVDHDEPQPQAETEGSAGDPGDPGDPNVSWQPPVHGSKFFYPYFWYYGYGDEYKSSGERVQLDAVPLALVVGVAALLALA